VPINPPLGVGYQSFLGPRIERVWARLSGNSVLAGHSCYFEIYNSSLA